MTEPQPGGAPAMRRTAATADRTAAPATTRRRGTPAPGRTARSAAARASAADAPHVLVAGIAPALRDDLVQCLNAEGMPATAVGAADDLSGHVQRLQPQLVLLGVGPQAAATIDGCARLRADGRQVPLILVAARHDEVDCVLGLESGADDYIVLPLSTRELLARCRAVLRRAQRAAGTPCDDLPPVKIGDCEFDPARRRITRGAEERRLRGVEYAILAELLRHPAEPVSRQRLLAVSHASGKAPLPRSIDTAMMRLRRLVEPEPAHPLYLQTLHGRGYMFLPTGRRGR